MNEMTEMRARIAAINARRRATLGDRIVAHIRIDQETACWVWTGSINNCGYGRIKVAGRVTYAHRASYIEFVGPIHQGLEIDHLCRNRACCNPGHLELVTASVNNRRGIRWNRVQA